MRSWIQDYHLAPILENIEQFLILTWREDVRWEIVEFYSQKDLI